jgi:PleD family two-component response regulator
LITITLSAGMLLVLRSAGESLSALLERADAALYAAKAGGRNLVYEAEPAPAPGQ